MSMKQYLITQYGAVQSDRLQTRAIQAAIDDCFLSGGGEVVVPEGIWRTGGIRLRSHVTLHLLCGAVLEGSTDPEDYLAWREDPLEPVDGIPEKEPERYRSALRTSRWNNALIRAFDAHDIAVIGEVGSVINGMNCYDALGEEGYRGPHGINLWDCENVTLCGYTLRNTGNWAHAIFRTKSLDIRNVRVLGGHDGVDIFLCEGVKIEDCAFYTGDDSLAGFGSRNVVMRRCILNSSCSAIRFGGTDVLIEDCRTDGEPRFDFRGALSDEEKARSAYSGHLTARKTLTGFMYYCDERFGKLPYMPGNITVRRCVFDDVRTLFTMMFGDHIWCKGTSLASITFEDCTAAGVVLPIHIHGDPENPVAFTLNRVTISPAAGHESDAFLDAEHYRSLTLQHVQLAEYTAPHMVLRSKGEVTASDCTDFRTEQAAAGASGVIGW